MLGTGLIALSHRVEELRDVGRPALRERAYEWSSGESEIQEWEWGLDWGIGERRSNYEIE